MLFTFSCPSWKNIIGILISVFCLQGLNAAESNASVGADVIVFSYDNPMQLYALLESIELHVTGLNSIQVIYRASDDTYKKAYQQIWQQFKNVRYRKLLGSLGEFEFKRQVISSMIESKSKYVLFAIDGVMVKESVNLNLCCKWLEQSDAYAFYLRLGKNITFSGALNCAQSTPDFISTQDGVCQWQFNKSSCDWNTIFDCEMTLYRKDDILRFVIGYNYGSPDELLTCFNYNHDNLLARSGLCFSESKAVTVIRYIASWNAYRYRFPYLTAKEMLEKFEVGFKFDVSTLSVTNTSTQIEYIPCYTLRN